MVNERVNAHVRVERVMVRARLRPVLNDILESCQGASRHRPRNSHPPRHPRPPSGFVSRVPAPSPGSWAEPRLGCSRVPPPRLFLLLKYRALLLAGSLAGCTPFLQGEKFVSITDLTKIHRDLQGTLRSLMEGSAHLKGWQVIYKLLTLARAVHSRWTEVLTYQQWTTKTRV